MQFTSHKGWISACKWSVPFLVLNYGTLVHNDAQGVSSVYSFDTEYSAFQCFIFKEMLVMYVCSYIAWIQLGHGKIVTI